MDPDFVDVQGLVAAPDALQGVKARDLAFRLQNRRIDFAELVECRITESAEAVVFDVVVEIPQRPVNPIRRRERIAVTFADADDRMPTVHALRRDFPLVPHLNLHIEEFPRNLCIYEDRYEELKQNWTSPRLVADLREWLRLTSIGTLHPSDQPLEPLLINHAGHIVLPLGLFEDTPEQLLIIAYQSEADRLPVLIAHRLGPKDQSTERPAPLRFVAAVIRCDPARHGMIRRSPKTLADLSALAGSAGRDLLGILRTQTQRWKSKHLDHKVAVVLIFPQTRTDGGAVERHYFGCFLIDTNVRELGVAIDAWQMIDGRLGDVLTPRPEANGATVGVLTLNPTMAHSRAAAAEMNGLLKVDDRQVVGVGCGALGSQVVLNEVRAGFGRWTLIDPDPLLPHNLARHALDERFVGVNKADALSLAANRLIQNEPCCVALDHDVLHKDGRSDASAVAIEKADVIVDMSAALPVQRWLARDLAAAGRRICVFLTPSGSDLVIIAEDAKRLLKLDALEMQYYRALLHERSLDGHLSSTPTKLRYARSCGDTTSTIPHDRVALHAAIASARLKTVIESDDAFIGIWRMDADQGVRHVNVVPEPTEEGTVGAWTVVVDEGFLARLRERRNERLPKETGGVLLGSFDMERSLLYLVDALPSPSDSKEEVTQYIRGSNGLRAAVEEVGTKTGSMLKYVGEWHSHPEGHDARPSGDDRTAHNWLTKVMGLDGLPTVMMIVGDHESRIIVGDLSSETRLR